MRSLLFALGMLVAFVRAADAATRELITCGRERVMIIDLDARDAAGAPKIIWTWQAAGRADLPAEYQSVFRSTDECKPVDGGRRILITSSGIGGAVALVERSDGSVVFYGHAVNAHSAELLPGSRVAVAASVDPKGQNGDALIVFDVAHSGRELFRTELPHGHGVVWDQRRNRLWALAYREIRSYALKDWSGAHPALERLSTFELPDSSGHDLYPVPGTALLSVTTAHGCWVFDRDRQTLARHPLLGDRADIKCISEHPATHQIVFTEAERPNWWTTRIRFLRPEDSLSLGAEQFYKVRWNLPAD